ncbi:hypothetical protein L2Y96_10520 [Luteibacter aegosomaticola]|uniref:hypothetical protein n=1 Tax=Luteibacter aegosomaticola TaxID=2911538 RepID=UPI001FFA440A|nr:hypothetical protein [Luteibacter aegosomaticola]UPG92173.1 hypothetical protein L2Y96_10520 [Luteibacter aegosomaticola]
MNPILASAALAIAAVLPAGHPATGQLPEKPVVLQFGPGINHVKLDGQPYTLVSAWRDNGNAHGYNVVNVYTDGPVNHGATTLAAVPAFVRDPTDPKKKQPEELGLTTSGGADCTLHTFRIFYSNDTKGTQLVIADREFGKSFADTEEVHFTFYRLVDHSDDGAGDAPHSFDFDRVVEAKARYCDVDEALQKELGMPPVVGASLPWAGE